jgi:hypothetical protein
LLVDILYIYFQLTIVSSKGRYPSIKCKNLKALSGGEIERGLPMVSSTFLTFGLSRAAGLISTAQRKRILAATHQAA